MNNMSKKYPLINGKWFQKRLTFTHWNWKSSMNVWMTSCGQSERDSDKEKTDKSCERKNMYSMILILLTTSIPFQPKTILTKRIKKMYERMETHLSYSTEKTHNLNPKDIWTKHIFIYYFCYVYFFALTLYCVSYIDAKVH